MTGAQANRVGIPSAAGAVTRNGGPWIHDVTERRDRPLDRDVLTALATYEAKLGHWPAASGWAQKLVDLRPEDAEARALLAQLDRLGGRVRRRP